MKLKLNWILFFIILFYFINNYIWLTLNYPPSAEDEFIHLSTSLSYYVYFFKPEFRKLVELFSHPYWAPFYHITGVFSSLLFSPQYNFTVLFTNLFYFVVMLFALFSLGEGVSSSSSGLWACVLISLSPVIYGYSRIFMLEMGVISLVAVAYYVVFNFDNFHHLRRYLYLGLVLIIGGLIKWTFYIFILFPLLFLSFKKVKKQRLYLLFLLLAVICMASLWYGPRFEKFLFKAKIYILKSGGGGEAFSFHNCFKEFVFYLKNLIFYYWSVPLSVIVLFSLISKSLKHYKFVFYLSIIFSLCFFSVLRSHNERHLMPIMVPMALIGGDFLRNIFMFRNKVKYLCGIMLVWAGINFFIISYLPCSVNFYKYIGYIPRKIRGGEGSFLLSCTCPHREDWKYFEMLRIMNENHKKGSSTFPVKYVIFSNDWIRFASTSLYYFDLVSKLKSGESKFIFLPAESPEKVDYLIVVNKAVDEENIWLDEKMLYKGAFIDLGFPIQERYWLLNNRSKFIKVGRIELPGSKTANIFMRKIATIKNETFKIIVNPQGINLITKGSHYLTEFVLVDKPSHLISSFEGVFDYWEKDDNIYWLYRWYDNPFYIAGRIFKEDDSIVIYFSPYPPFKELFFLVYPSEYRMQAEKGHKYLDLNNSLYKSKILTSDVLEFKIGSKQEKFNQIGCYSKFKNSICVKNWCFGKICIKEKVRLEERGRK